MFYQQIKNFTLTLMVILCIYLSSKIWFKLPEFLEYNFEKEDDINNSQYNIAENIWNIVTPYKSIVKYKENFTILYVDKDDLWGKLLKNLKISLEDYNNSEVLLTKEIPENYVNYVFENSIPCEFFTENMSISNKEVTEKIKKIKNIFVDLDDINSLYINNEDEVLKITNKKIETQQIFYSIIQMDFDKFAKYSFDEIIDQDELNISVPIEKTATSPIIVQSELDVLEKDEIDKIAKGYFKNTYEYVRKHVEINGKLVYMYRTEKVLKINEEGLLEFYDSSVEESDSRDLYKSFLSAFKFVKSFLGFPEECFLSEIQEIQDGQKQGYRFIFSYKILDRPILFSKIRDNSCIQIDVIGEKVVSYTRFVRKISEKLVENDSEVELLSAAEVIKNNISTDEDLNSDVKKILTKDMIKDIDNIYLAYFDLSRIAKEQLLRVVWVIEIKDKTYIFNAIRGALIEEW